MNFSKAEKDALTSIWAMAASRAGILGLESLKRLFTTYPQIKINFKQFDLSPDSKDLHKHGGKVLKALGKATRNLDDLDNTISKMSDLHPENLKVDPGNFALLGNAIQETLAVHFPKEFDAFTQSAWDKFLSAVTSVLVLKYR